MDNFYGLGSVVGEVDPAGSLTSSPKYDVYGLVSNPSSASGAMDFVGGLGHLSEAGTGLIYMKARYYDPSLGKFVSENSEWEGASLYIYCFNNVFTLLVGFVFGLICLVQFVKSFRQHRLQRLWWLMPYTLGFACLVEGSLLHIKALQTTQSAQLKAINAADYAMFIFMALGAGGTLKQKVSR